MQHTKRIMGLILVLGLVLALAGLACAAEEADFEKYPQIVDTAFVKQVVDGDVAGLIVDSRPAKPMYEKGHLPKAVSMPHSQFDKMAASVLPADKGSLIVFYCGGLKCPLSHKSAFAAEKLGYTNIKVYAEGYPAWVKAHGEDYQPKSAQTEAAFDKYPQIVDAAFVKDISDGKTLGLIVDSRPKKKMYDKGHIPGSISMSWSDFDKMKGLLPADKNALVVFYCGGVKCPLSHKSAFAAEKLGYTNVKVFADGYPVWTKAYGEGATGAQAAKSEAPQVAKKFKAGTEEGSIDHEVFNKLVADGAQGVTIIDVRDAPEFAKGHVPGAVNVPTDQLEKKLPEMKMDQPVIFVCNTGARSGEAYYMVKDLRPQVTEVYYVDGEIDYPGGEAYKLKAKAN